MSLLNNDFVKASGSYQITNSLKTNGAGYLSRTLGTFTDRTRSSHSFWMKKCVSGSSAEKDIGIGSLCITQTSFANGGDSLWVGANNPSPYTYTKARYRDPSAWMHVLVTFDYNASSGSRVKLYINGVATTDWYSYGEGYGVDAFGTGCGPWGSSGTSAIATAAGALGSSTYWWDGYLAEVVQVDGQVLMPTSFGKFDDSGVWVPIKYIGTYGLQGVYLNFKNAANLGQDTSGNGNNFTVTNFTSTNQSSDTPTNNYCTLNPLKKYGTNTPTLSNGNITFSCQTYNYPAYGSVVLPQGGKWWWEVTIGGTAAAFVAGVQSASETTSTGTSAGWYEYTRGQIVGSGFTVLQDYLGVIGAGNVVGFAADTTSNPATLAIYYNNTGVTTQKGTTVTLSSGVTDWVPWFDSGSGSVASSGNVNFGQRLFSLNPPSGFKALCTANLPAVAITKPGNYFNAVTRTGNGTTQATTGVGFQPDLVWDKSRSNASSYELYDSVRGATKYLWSDSTATEGTDANRLTSFDSDGFTMGSTVNVNGGGRTFVDWCWKKGSTPGFDIQRFTSPASGNFTVAHNLGKKPAFIIMKPNDVSIWGIWHQSFSNQINNTLRFTTNAIIDYTGAWGAGHTSSNLGFVVNDFNINPNTVCIAYAWAEVPGFSKFGSYTGNGSVDGPFVYCGFKPKYILIKVASGTTGVWVVHDTSREPYNESSYCLYPNQSTAETAESGNSIDILSNGFKVHGTNSGSINYNGATMIYAAFAEHPFGGSNVAPATAR